jgi:2-methylcitrate dehydratase PrpD
MTKMDAQGTQALARYVANLRSDDLPAVTILAAKRVFLDLVSLVPSGRDHPAGRILLEHVLEQDGGSSATVLGTQEHVSPANAALLTGVFAANTELDDVHPVSNLHAGSVIVPALLALGEHLDATGGELIASLVAAYDVGCRVSNALGPQRQYDRGFHPTAVAGVFGAAAGAAKLFHMDANSIDEVLGLAGCQASGLLTWKMEEAHFAKSWQSGHAARCAVVAAELVAKGFHGPRGSLDGRVNILRAFSDAGISEPLSQGLGEVYEIENTTFKFHSCCLAIHSAIDCLLDLMIRTKADAADLAEIKVWLPFSCVPTVDNNELITHNLQFVMAVAAQAGKVGPQQMTLKRFADPTIRDLASRVRLAGDAGFEEVHPEHWPARVEIMLRDGASAATRRQDPRGSKHLPATDRELEDKARSELHGILRSNSIERLIADVWSLEELVSVRAFVSRFAVPSGSGMGERG